MKPAHFVLLGASLLLGWGFWAGGQPSRVAHTDPLDTDAFPLRFADQVRLPVASSVPPLPVAAKPPARPALREPWQTTALNDGLRWMLTEGLRHYSTQSVMGKIYFDPAEYPEGFDPQVTSFEFIRSVPPHHGAIFGGLDFLMHMNGAWKEQAPASNMWSQGVGGPQVASFSLVLGGQAGMGSVDLNTVFGVFKGTNGYVTKVLLSFDP